MARATMTRARDAVLKLMHQGELRVLRSDGAGMRIGRDKENDLVTTATSLRAARTGVAREGHFVLVDQSSNGT